MTCGAADEPNAKYVDTPHFQGDVFVGAMELENTANNDFMAETIKSGIPGIIDGDGKISVPSVVQYQPGNNVAFVEYTGPRTGDVIVEYAKKESLRLISKLSTNIFVTLSIYALCVTIRHHL